MMDRNNIIKALHAALEPLPYIHALWLEAYAHYNQYLLNPLIDLLRVIYKPAWIWFAKLHSIYTQS